MTDRKALKKQKEALWREVKVYERHLEFVQSKIQDLRKEQKRSQKHLDELWEKHKALDPQGLSTMALPFVEAK